MKPIKLKPGPADGVHINDPDGHYFFLGTGENADMIQILIKGPMIKRPGHYEALASKQIGYPVALRSSSFLPFLNPSPKQKLALLRAGFISLEFGRK